MKKITLILFLFLLAGIDLYAAGLGGVTSKLTTLRADVVSLVKVLAGFGLLFILGSYFISSDENKRFPWKWFIAAFAVGAFAQILALFGLT